MILQGINFVAKSVETVKFAAGWGDMVCGNMGFFSHRENLFADMKSAQEAPAQQFPL
jgi:hypothetical protein